MWLWTLVLLQNLYEVTKVSTSSVWSWWESRMTLARNFAKWYEVGTKLRAWVRSWSEVGEVLLLSKKKCVPAARKHSSLLNNYTCLFCWTRTHVVLLNNKIWNLAQREHILIVRRKLMSSCSTNNHMFSFNEKTCLLANKGNTNSWTSLEKTGPT